MNFLQEKPVILFDGVCNLCNGAVNFVIRRDKKKKFMFAALQSDAGRALREKYSLSLSSMVDGTGIRCCNVNGLKFRKCC